MNHPVIRSDAAGLLPVTKKKKSFFCLSKWGKAFRLKYWIFKPPRPRMTQATIAKRAAPVHRRATRCGLALEEIEKVPPRV